ncbi:hypothetical protein HF086_018243 [Spodoptera exigua]|uniref:Uncharacterized protein n=1 Tax=Spodoptera exigua TaxID=7107 RepID=A0A922M5S7_SPOEX|nr:hypothetical protein HF086_018243 [Spodoptera exigua]
MLPSTFDAHHTLLQLHMWLYIPSCHIALAESRLDVEYNADLHYPSSTELLIPLLTSAAASGEPYERARSDHDAPFSNIPDSAFTLDEGILDADSASHPTAAPQRVHKKVPNIHEVDYYRPRSIYVSSMEQRAERPADAWSACRSLLQEPAAAHLEVLLLLCAELLDAPSPSVEQRARDLPRPSTAQPCACCPETARRDYMRMGDNADM